MFVEGFYITGNKAKAENLIEDIFQQYEGRFAMIANFSQNNQKLIFDHKRGSFRFPTVGIYCKRI